MKRTPIRKVSKKMASAHREYAKLRKEYLTENPKCGLCNEPATEIHHKARRGKMLLVQEFWVGLCSDHHRYVEANPEWSRKNGMMVDKFNPYNKSI